MTKPVATPKHERMFLNVIIISMLAGVILWVLLIEPFVSVYIEQFIGKTISELGGFAGLLYFMIGSIFAMACATLIVIVFFSYRYELPKKNEAYARSLADLSNARETLEAATKYIEEMENELKEKSSHYEQLTKEIDSMSALNSDSVEELKSKLSAIDTLSRNKIWTERLISFSIGVISSILAAFLFQLLSHTS